MAFYFPTERLVVRPWREADRPALAHMAGDREMMRYVTGRPWTDEQIDELLERQRRHVREHGVCMGAVEHAETGRVIGMAGMQPLDDGSFELGWWIWRDHWGRGYALEAIRPFLAHARNMGLDRLYAVIDPPNAASIRVAEKLGMRFDRLARAGETRTERGDGRIALYVLDLEA